VEKPLEPIEEARIIPQIPTEPTGAFHTVQKPPITQTEAHGDACPENNYGSSDEYWEMKWIKHT